MGRMAARGTSPGFANAGDGMMKHRNHSYAAAIAVMMLIVGWSFVVIHTAHSQSGRQKNLNAKPSPTPASQRPRQATTKTIPPPPVMTQTAKSAANDNAASADDVVRVSSHLV